MSDDEPVRSFGVRLGGSIHAGGGHRWHLMTASLPLGPSPGKGLAMAAGFALDARLSSQDSRNPIPWEGSRDGHREGSRTQNPPDPLMRVCGLEGEATHTGPPEPPGFSRDRGEQRHLRPVHRAGRTFFAVPRLQRVIGPVLYLNRTLPEKLSRVGDGQSFAITARIAPSVCCVPVLRRGGGNYASM
jgi:hypothetical protein